MATLNYMTEEGYKKLMEEINRLESVERPKISRQIAEARDKGDLSENAEYDAVREAQGLLELKIAQLKTTVSNVRIIDESHMGDGGIQILSKVTIKNVKTSQKMTYTLVSEAEANIREFKMAISTPIAKSLIGKKKGDHVTVEAPSGIIEFEILETGF